MAISVSTYELWVLMNFIVDREVWLKDKIRGTGPNPFAKNAKAQGPNSGYVWLPKKYRSKW